eukprot:gene10478-7283_t
MRRLSTAILSPSISSAIAASIVLRSCALVRGSATPSTPSLRAQHERIASMWVAAVSSKMLQPHHVPPDSKKLVRWSCRGCGASFSRRVDLHVNAGGECPKCKQRPSRRRVASRAERPVEATLAKPPSSRAQRSVADDAYFERHEHRILLPMLAKNFEKESGKIEPSETLYVSPKLDGVRCVASYSRKTGKMLFFSRAGTLFECCDVSIEQPLRVLFEKDPSLVLDGELYNDSANLRQLRRLPAASRKSHAWLLGSQGLSGAKAEVADINFETLISAIRTSRAKRTPEVEALQCQLQFHIFDVMYASELKPGQPFSQRWELLQRLMRCPHPALRLVPAAPCHLEDVNTRLQQALGAGYEGIMVRRDSLLPAGQRQGAAGLDRSGGYAYGHRSGTLLKYKVMHDEEFIIVGAMEGKGKLVGSLGAFVCRAKKNPSATFCVSLAASEETKRRIWAENKGAEFVGKALTVQFQELTSEGIPRFPVGKCVRGTSKKDWI